MPWTILHRETAQSVVLALPVSEKCIGREIFV